MNQSTIRPYVTRIALKRRKVREINFTGEAGMSANAVTLWIQEFETTLDPAAGIHVAFDRGEDDDEVGDIGWKDKS